MTCALSSVSAFAVACHAAAADAIAHLRRSTMMPSERPEDLILRPSIKERSTGAANRSDSSSSIDIAIDFPQRFAQRQVRLFVLVAFLLAVGLLIWRSSQSTSSGPAYGVAMPVSFADVAPPPKPATSFRLTSFNIHSGNGSDGRYDLGRTAGLLKDSTLAGLNEVRGAWFFGNDQIVQLAQSNRCAGLFAPTETRLGLQSFGNGLLSRCSVDWWQRIPLMSSRGRGERNILLLQCTPVVGKPGIRVMITHIDRLTDRSEQLRCALAMFMALEAPAVLMGDLNTRADDAQMITALQLPGVIDAVAVGSKTPPPVDRIDWMLVRGLDVESAELVATEASDHPVLHATLKHPDTNLAPATN